MEDSYFNTGRIRLKTKCEECGYKHQEGRVCGIFVPKDFLGGRYDEPDTPRDWDGGSDDEVEIGRVPGGGGNNDDKDPELVEKDETEVGLGNLFGASLAAPKTGETQSKSRRTRVLTPSIFLLSFLSSSVYFLLGLALAHRSPRGGQGGGS